MTLRTTTSPIKKRGFTLVELLVVIAVMAILASIVVPVTIHYIDDAQQAADTVYTQDVAAWATSVIIDLRARQGLRQRRQRERLRRRQRRVRHRSHPRQRLPRDSPPLRRPVPLRPRLLQQRFHQFRRPRPRRPRVHRRSEGFDKTTGDFIAIALTLRHPHRPTTSKAGQRFTSQRVTRVIPG